MRIGIGIGLIKIFLSEMNKTDEHSTIRQDLGGLWRVCQGYIEVIGHALERKVNSIIKK